MAFFLGHEPQERREIFITLKRAYAIRLKIVHGATISAKDQAEAVALAVAVDDLIRRIFKKIYNSDEVAAQFERTDMDDYFLGLTFAG